MQVLDNYFEKLQKDNQVCPLPKEICAQQVGDNQIILCNEPDTTLDDNDLFAIPLHLLTLVVSHHLKLTYQLQYFKMLWHLIFHPKHKLLHSNQVPATLHSWKC